MLRLRELIDITGGTFMGNEADLDKEMAAARIDSRAVEPGDIFFAVKGEKTDGHNYVKKAHELGALCSICERDTGDDCNRIIVKDSLAALRQIAVAHRDRLSIPIVGISGSVGKTSTKEAIAYVLSAKYKTQKTAGNYNNDIGVPVTLLSINDSHEAAVVEMGISDFGEMDLISSFARPDICVLTNIGQCHLENLGTQEGIMKAKTEMFAHRNKKGAVILNGDDPLLNTIQDVDGTKPVRFGYGENCDVRVENVNPKGLLGTDFDLVIKGERRISCHCDIPGVHGAINAACAAAVGLEMGLDDEQIRQGIAQIKALPGRSNIIHTDDHIIIDDCYNANPVSMKAALDMLSLWEGRKVALLGDMFELGSDEKKLHFEVGEHAGKNGIDLLLAVGDLASNLADGAISAGMDETAVIRLKDTDEAKEKISEYIKKGDALLIKASHGMHFEKIVALF